MRRPLFGAVGRPFGVGAPPATVSDQSISFGALTLASAGGAQAVNSAGAYVDFTAVTAQGGATRTWSVSGGRLIASGTPGVDNGIILTCTVTGGTSISVTIDASAANDYDVITAAQLTSVFTAIGAGDATARNIWLRPSVRLEPFSDSWYSNRTRTAMLTTRSRDNAYRGTIEGGSAANTDARLSNPGYFDFYQVIIEGEFDRTQMTDVVYVLDLAGTQAGPITFRDCEAKGTPWSTIGAGIHFRGFIGNTATFVHSGLLEISDCVIHDLRRGMTIVANDNDGTAIFTVKENEIYNIAVDYISIAGDTATVWPVGGSQINFNNMHSPYTDKERANFVAGAKLASAGALTGAADAKKALIYVNMEFGDAISGVDNLILTYAGITLKRNLTTGFISLIAKDTSAADAITLVGATAAGSYRRILILASLDTDGTSRLYVGREGADGLATWTEDATATAAGQTLDLTGVVTVGPTSGTPDFYFNRQAVWQNVAPDITSSTVRDYFADAMGIRTAASISVAQYGTPILDFYGHSYTVWRAGINQGSGGNLTRTGTVELDHGDMIQMAPNADITGWEIIGNRMLSARSDALAGTRWDYHDFQGIFLEDTGAAGNNYIDFIINGNLMALTGHGIFLSNAINCIVAGNTAVINPAWTADYVSDVPGVLTNSHNGGTGSGNNFYDTVAGDIAFAATVTGTQTNCIESTPVTVGANSYANLFVGLAGGSFAITSVAEMEEAFAPKPGGALATASPVIGHYYADYVAHTFVSPRFGGSAAQFLLLEAV